MAEVYRLLFCGTCHKKIEKDEALTEWEGDIYCEPCFADYLSMIEERVLKTMEEEYGDDSPFKKKPEK